MTHTRMLMTTKCKLCRELKHENVVSLEEVLLEDKAIFMVFEYAEHDFLVKDKAMRAETMTTDTNPKVPPTANHPLSFTH